MGLWTVVLCSAVLCGPRIAQAQLSGLSTSGSQVTGSGTDIFGLSGSTAGGVSVVTNTATQLKTKLGMNVNADALIFLTSSQSGNATHRVSFTASSATPYRLTIDTQLRGDLNRYNDLLLLPCDGSADVSGVSGTSSVALSGGSLNIADPGVLATGGSNLSMSFNGTASATIDRPAGGTVSPVLTFTFNGQASSASCESAVRVGAQNGSTLDCAACGYPGAPSRTQADDGHFVTVRFTSLAGSCGNLIVEASEQCDIGSQNGQPGQCCSGSCQLVPPAVTCTAGTVGGSCGDGVVQSGEQCDLGAQNGQAGRCCTAGCQYAAASTACRGAAAGDECDATEYCTGASAVCPADVLRPIGTVCRAAAGSCDSAEVCTGTGRDCPADAMQPSTTVCRAQNGVCDVPERCTGSSASCPADAFASSATVCRAASSGAACDLSETCTGSSASCPADAVRPAGTACPDDGNVCTADRCDGTSKTCAHPAGNAGVICRGSSAGNACDVPEACNGTSTTCPADVVRPAGTPCGSSSDTACDDPDTCNGAGACLPNTAPNGTPCGNPANSECDLTDTCNAGTCQANVRPAGTACSDDGLACTADQCNGSGACTHPVRAAGTVCRSAAGICDVAETCNGVSGSCPANTFASASTTCRGSAGVCDAPETCSGSSASCPADVFASSSTVCRSASAGGACDATETCTGSGAACPADGYRPDGSACDDGNPLTSPDSCSAGMCVGSGDPGGDADCPPTPADQCLRPVEPGAAQLRIRYDSFNPDAGTLKWNWKKGAATSTLAFGNPFTGGDTSYAFCLYLDGTLLYESTIPSGYGWVSAARGPKFKDHTLAHEGMSRINLKSGAVGKSKITVKTRATNLTPLQFTGSLVSVRLHNNHDMCWGADFDIFR